jgi:hypothetical protein
MRAQVRERLMHCFTELMKDVEQNLEARNRYLLSHAASSHVATHAEHGVELCGSRAISLPTAIDLHRI